MPSESGKCCDTCAFFVPYPAHIADMEHDLGECRGGVPQIDWTDGGKSAAFPPTHSANWCGRWVDKVAWDRERT